MSAVLIVRFKALLLQVAIKCSHSSGDFGTFWCQFCVMGALYVTDTNQLTRGGILQDTGYCQCCSLQWQSLEMSMQSGLHWGWGAGRCLTHSSVEMAVSHWERQNSSDLCLVPGVICACQEEGNREPHLKNNTQALNTAE